jgi:hypothetical protein
MIVQEKLDAKAAQSFGHRIYEQIAKGPFTTIPKSELDQILLAALIEAKQIDPDDPVYETARKLQLTTTKTDSLLHGYRLRAFTEDLSSTQIAEHIKVVELNPQECRLTLNIESRFWRDAFIHLLKKKNYFTDTSFNRERITIEIDHFLDFIVGEFQEHELLAKAKDLYKVKKREARKKALLGFLGAQFNATTGQIIATSAIPIGVTLSSLFLA